MVLLYCWLIQNLRKHYWPLRDNLFFLCSFFWFVFVCLWVWVFFGWWWWWDFFSSKCSIFVAEVLGYKPVPTSQKWPRNPIIPFSIVQWLLAHWIITSILWSGDVQGQSAKYSCWVVWFWPAISKLSSDYVSVATFPADKIIEAAVSALRRNVISASPFSSRQGCIYVTSL